MFLDQHRDTILKRFNKLIDTRCIDGHKVWRTWATKQNTYQLLASLIRKNKISQNLDPTYPGPNLQSVAKKLVNILGKAPRSDHLSATLCTSNVADCSCLFLRIDLKFRSLQNIAPSLDVFVHLLNNLIIQESDISILMYFSPNLL